MNAESHKQPLHKGSPFIPTAGGFIKNTLLAVAAISVFFAVPLRAAVQSDVENLTPAFIGGGVTIDRLLVWRVGDIVLLRGRTSDPIAAEQAGRFAAEQGYKRVANLIEIVPGIGDAGIELLARHRLEMSRELVGCTFKVDSSGGVVSLSGHVAEEAQKSFAVDLVARIDGVKMVHSTLASPRL